MNTSTTYALTGPQGCGKTLHAEALAAKLGCKYIVDDWDGHEVLRTGTLAITNAEVTPREGLVVLEVTTEADVLRLLAYQPASLIPLPPLAEGEHYIATLFDASTQQGHHIILLPGDNDDANWQAQMDWAKSLGGDLPTRIEQAILYDRFKDQFQSDWYWSNTQHASNASYAWTQYFGNGYQGSSKSFEGRARAVRRLPI